MENDYGKILTQKINNFSKKTFLYLYNNFSFSIVNSFYLYKNFFT